MTRRNRFGVLAFTIALVLQIACKNVAENAGRDGEKIFEKRKPDFPASGARVASNEDREALRAVAAKLNDGTLDSAIEDRIKSCPGVAVVDGLTEVAKESMKAAWEADKPGTSWEQISGAAQRAARESAEKQGGALPVGFLECVILKPAFKAYEACGNNPASGCFRQQLPAALASEE
ncbi:MAG: hypothetical protein ABJC09_01330 [Terriglobia bacterium]